MNFRFLWKNRAIFGKQQTIHKQILIETQKCQTYTLGQEILKENEWINYEPVDQWQNLRG